MSEQLLNIIKKAAKEAIDETTPANIMFGTVTKASPLTINVEQKLTLTEEFLILTKNVIDFKVDVTVNWNTGTSSSHHHEISGKKTLTIHNALKKGDKVILIRQHGGQKYVVLDKIY